MVRGFVAVAKLVQPPTPSVLGVSFLPVLEYMSVFFGLLILSYNNSIPSGE